MTAIERQDELADEMQDQVLYSEQKASINQHSRLPLVFVALGCTLAAAVLGLASLASKAVIGGIAGLRAVIAVIAATFNLEGRLD